MKSRVIGFALVVVALGSCSTTRATTDETSRQSPQPGQTGSTPTAPTPGGRALLVGITRFIDKDMQTHNLVGPGNDVGLFRQLLEDAPFRFQPDRIRTLAGLPDDANQRPTRANIEREFAHLAQVASKDDQIVILMAGHGSQQPDNNNDETDGFDEIFLPADTAGWDGRAGVVRNAIADDDIGRWLDAIRQKGAFVWIIFDSCQSGTMTRGGPEVARQIDPTRLIPGDAIAAATARAKARGGKPESAVLDLKPSGQIAAFYAAHMTEPTHERPLPEADSPSHGVFTYTITDILKKRSSPISYQELIEAVMQRYRAEPRSTTPMSEGSGLDREVLGVANFSERPQILFGAKMKEGDWEVRAGSVSGVTKGSVLEVFPPAGSPNSDKSIGFVQVRAGDATRARVVPIPFADRPAPSEAQLVAGSRAQVAHYEPGDWQLKVAFQVQDPRKDAQPGDYVVASAGATPVEVSRALAGIEASSRGLVGKVDADPADWYLRIVNNQLIVVPAAGWLAPPGTPPAAARTLAPEAFAIASPSDPQLSQLLGNALARIARARNLTRLASASSSAAQLEIEVVLHTPARRVFRPTPNQFSLHDGDQVDFRIKNTGAVPLDVTVVFMSSCYGLTPLWPGADSAIDNRIEPGKEVLAASGTINAESVGWESVIAIGVESTNVRQRFPNLQQECLKAATTTRSVEGARQVVSPLARIMEDSVLGPGGRTRNFVQSTNGKYAVQVVTWRTERR